MTKNEMKMKLAKQVGLSAVKCNEVLDAIFDAEKGIIANTIANGEKLAIPGFGTFNTKKMEARKGVNPSTGKKIQISARTKVTFKVGKTLKERIE